MPFTPDYEVPAERQAYTLRATPGDGEPRVACLMLHGFMGSPASSRDMAEYLAGQGISVHCPLLPGHGHLPYRIHGVSRHAWLREAEEALATVRQFADQIFLMGHSMGAVLCAYLADKNPDLRGLVMLAPLYDVPDKRIKLARFGRYFIPWFYPLKHAGSQRHIFLGRVLDFDPTIDVDDPALQDWLNEATRIPLSGADEMCRMAGLGRKLWPRLRLPALIIQGGKDPAVSPGNSEKILKSLSSQNKKLENFPLAGHELMRPFEPAHTAVWQLIHQFVQDQTVSEGRVAIR